MQKKKRSEILEPAAITIQLEECKGEMTKIAQNIMKPG